KAVADAQHEPALAREADHRLHHRGEARDRTGAQVVAVGEAAGDDDRVGPTQAGIAVPQELRPAHAACGLQSVQLVAGAREAQYAELHRAPSLPPASSSNS